MKPLNIIVPIYRGIELTQRCLESIASSDLPAACRVTLIDDASPDLGMNDMLKGFVEAANAARLERNGADGPVWELLTNAANLGFVGTVNRGMARWPDHDVVLLNNDTELPPCWVQRLQGAAYRRSRIGTVTPFTNSGSLASYPLPNVENDLPAGWSARELDRHFRTVNAGAAIEIPIGVGFCLFIRRECLDEVGAFDEATFGRGYGEENDFCLRASQRGWKHILAADCFVYHRARGSFGDEKDARVRGAYELLVRRYPHYPALVQSYVAKDPARRFRQRVDFLRLAVGPVAAEASSAKRRGPGELHGPVLELQRAGGRYFELRWTGGREGFTLWFRLPDEIEDLRTILDAADMSLGNYIPSSAALFSLPSRARDAAALGGAVLDLIDRHSVPRVGGWYAARRALARWIGDLSASRLTRSLVGFLPAAVVERMRNWVKGARA